MSILALVLGAAYATTNRSLRTGTDAGVRSQATSYAQQQVEILKAIALNNPEKISTFKVGRPFCIDPATTALKEVDTDLNGDGTNDACGLPVGSADPTQPYSLIVRYYPADAAAGLPKNTFVVKSQWPSSTTANEQSSVSLHYKPQDNFVTMNSSEISAPPPTETDLSAPNLPTITLTRSTSAVLPGNSATITWSITKATTCTASSSPSSATWNGPIPVAANGTADGSRPTGSLTADTTFTIDCQRTGAGNRQASISVGVQRITSFAPDSTPIPYNTSTTLRWTSTHTTSCSRGSAPNGSQSTGNLTTVGPNNFSLTCSGPGGTTPASNTTVTVNNPPPSITSFYASPGSVGYGGGTTLVWTSNYTTSCSRGSAPNGSQWTGALYSSQWFSLTCSGPGGSTSANTYVSVAPPPPPPPPPCSTWAGGDRSGDLVWLHASGSGCGYYLDTVVGWNGGFSWNGPHYVPGCYEHTQYGGTDPWGWLSSSTACP